MGPIVVSPRQISIGIVCNLFAIIPAGLIILCFRKSRRRTLRENRIDRALEQDQDNPEEEAEADAAPTIVVTEEDSGLGKKCPSFFLLLGIQQF